MWWGDIYGAEEGGAGVLCQDDWAVWVEEWEVRGLVGVRGGGVFSWICGGYGGFCFVGRRRSGMGRVGFVVDLFWFLTVREGKWGGRVCGERKGGWFWMVRIWCDG